jgi:hypothetical protein
MTKPLQKNAQLLTQIKNLAIQAMFSDDELLEQLVLKGGNAMALVHQISARASVDLDFSLKHDFSESVEVVQERILRALTDTFRASGFEVFDFKMVEKPKTLSPDMQAFWGGYAVEFKLVTADVHAQHSVDKEMLRKLAINLGQGTKFLIDISRFEYVYDKQEWDFEGTLIYVYSPMMIVCEKLRAICQQMAEYAPIVKRGHAGSARPKDFVDIHTLLCALELDITGEQMQRVLVSMFEAKKVPLSFLGQVKDQYDFHVTGFPSVEATVSPDFELKEFRFYFDYVTELIGRLQPFWHE